MKWPYRLYNGVRFPLDRPSLDNVEKIDTGIIPIVNQMMVNGIYIDVDYLHDFASYLKAEEDKRTEQVLEMTGYRLNLASGDQVADLLFRRLGIKPRWQLKLTDSGKREKVDDDVLESIKHLHPVVPILQEFNEHNKLRTSFAETLPTMVDTHGRVHGQIKMTRVITGRLAMSEPNLMGMPVRSDLGRRIRAAFKAPNGRMIGTIDLSQIQMRWAAHVAQCMNMIDIFLRGGDIHNETASRIFRLPVEKLDKMMHRHPAKRTGFGVLFMITGAGLRDQLVVLSDKSWTPAQKEDYVNYWTEDRCNGMIKDWYDVNFEIRDMQNDFITMARRYKMVWCQWGRPRLIPGVMSVHKHVRADAEREAGNSPIVMCEVGTMKLGMAQIWDTIQANGWDCMPLVQVHDELLWEGDDNLPYYLGEMSKIFANTAPIDVPIKASFAYGDKSWADLEK